MKEGKSLREIGKIFATDHLRIRKILVGYGIKISKQGGWASGLTKETHDGIRRSAESKRGIPRDSKTIKKMEGTFFKPGQTPWMKGRHHKKKSKALTRKSWKKKYASGYQHPRKGKPGHPNPRKGKTKENDATVAKIARKNTGKKRSAKSRKTMSVAAIKKFQEHPEIKDQISKSKKKESMRPFRRKQLREQRAKMRLPTYDTLPEKLLQKLCKEAEIEFQTQKDFNLGFQNHPVDVFIEPNICIEADGDFIHANPHPHLIPSRSSKIQSGYKPDKIIKHKLTAKWIHEHDAKINQALEQQGNVVLRFWQSELETEPKKCLQKIIKIIKEAKRI